MKKNLIYILALMVIACKSENSSTVNFKQQEAESHIENAQKAKESKIAQIKLPHNPFESIAKLKFLECKQPNYDSNQQQADSLQLFMLRSINSEYRVENGIKFFCSFPNSFEEMQNLFGFNNDTAGPLYSSSGKYLQKSRIYSDEIGFFTELSKLIPSENFYQKYISININGKWEADNMNEAFMIHNEIIDNTELLAPVLSKFNDEEIKSVFKFIFDGPHPKHKYNEKKYQDMSTKLKDDYKRLNLLMKSAYDELMSKDHIH